jgi:hypothetical protein
MFVKYLQLIELRENHILNTKRSEGLTGDQISFYNHQWPRQALRIPTSAVLAAQPVQISLVEDMNLYKHQRASVGFIWHEYCFKKLIATK